MDYIYITSHGQKFSVLPKVYNGMYRYCTEVLQKEDEVIERLQALFDEYVPICIGDVEEVMISAMRNEFLRPVPEEHETDAEIYWEAFLDDHYYTQEEKLILKDKALLDLECDYYLIAQAEAERQLEYGCTFESIDVIKYRLKKKKKEAFERYQVQMK